MWESILIGIVILAGLMALLALLLELAASYFLNYGPCAIKVNGEKEFVVEGGSSLLASLGSQGVFLPSACGGKGTCALCRARVLEGGGPLLPTEAPYLSPGELEKNYRLACQVKVRNDLSIVIPEELFLVREMRVMVTGLSDLTPAIKRIGFKILDGGEEFSFKPGQYVQLEVPKYEASSGPEFRAYSIASPAEMKGELELVITKVEEGIVSGYVHRKLREGEELICRGPYGDFYYQDSDRDLLLIATGSGIAPIRSILHHLKNESIKRKATFFFGDRVPEDLLYVDEMRQLEKELPDFTYIPTLSRVPQGANWEGEKGRVTDLIKKHLPQDAPVDVYICGSPPMVESCVKALTAKGVPEDRIFFDKFG